MGAAVRNTGGGRVSSLRDPQIPALFEGPEYHTPADAAGKRPVFPTLRLYRELLRLILRYRPAAIAGVYDRRTWAASCREFFRVVEHIGGRFHITGMEHVYALRNAVVFAGNHMSTLETFCLPPILLPYTPLTFVVKRSLVRMPLFGPIMRATQPIVVSRKKPRADFRRVVEQGLQRIRRGVSCCIFPQTTRTRVFRVNKFNSLAEKLALRAGCLIVPVAVKTDFWETGRIVRDLGRVYPEREIHFAFGPPIDPAASGRAARRLIVEFLVEHLSSWGVPCIGSLPAVRALQIASDRE